MKSLTTYLSPEDFSAKLAKAEAGQAIIYASGDIAVCAPVDPELFRLRRIVHQFYEAKVIALTQRARHDIPFIAGRAFDYIATKRAEDRL